MECTVYNPQKGRLETLEVEFTADNTTRFASRGNGSVTMITDWEGGFQGMTIRFTCMMPPGLTSDLARRRQES